jgi:nucleotide-binding universal stress UspA family protein
MTTPSRRILVGTDFSVASEQAVDRAVALAKLWSVPLVLHHVVAASFWEDVVGRAADATGLDPASPESAVAMAADLLRRRADEIEAASGVRCEVGASAGRAAAELTRVATDVDAGLLVIGSRGDHHVRHLFVGTTAQKLLRVSPCPVLVVKCAPPFDYGTVLAPTDFSDPSRAAVRTCLAWLPQATLHVAHAFELPYDGLARYAGVDAADLARQRRGAQARLEQTLVDFVNAAGVAPGQRVLHVNHGYPSTCIERWIDAIDADLVVMAAHGKSELEATFLGSVSLHTVLSATCDVLLLRGAGGT